MSISIKRHYLSNALRVAAEVFDDDAHVCSCQPGHYKIEQQFKAQAITARAVASYIEDGGNLVIED